MGLSINVCTRAPASVDLAGVGTIIAGWHGIAEEFAKEGRIARVFEPSKEVEDLNQFAMAWLSVPHATDPDTAIGVAVPPIEGWIFPVSVGEGCEPLVLGLCRYPAQVKNPGGGEPLPTDRGEGWNFLSSCKTQYASTGGWDHFRRCHVAAVELAAAGQALGVEVKIEDEGGYWPDRNEVALRAAVDRLNGLVAAVAGGLKDALDDDADDTGGTSAVKSPIFEHPAFESLEHAAQSGEDAEKIAEALRAIGKQRR